jgi:2-polyprenyl-3-methyl-5-hydroxy-6-metoxy-1,4-benzoquinol methylase
MRSERGPQEGQSVQRDSGAIERPVDAEGLSQELAKLRELIDEHVGDRGTLRVLEAGCGSMSRLKFPGHARVVGIDVSEVQLRNNTYLDEKILGDIETYDLPERSFDAIVCWNVFEHLPHPEQALSRFCGAVNPGGLIVLALPNPLSVKGLMTKFTPFWFHVWVTRHLVGRKLAGTEGHPPFPTFMRLSIIPKRLMRSAAAQGVTTLYFSLFEDDKQRTIRSKLRITGRRWRLVQRVVWVLTLGRIETVRAQCILVLKKTAGPATGATELAS